MKIKSFFKEKFSKKNLKKLVTSPWTYIFLAVAAFFCYVRFYHLDTRIIFDWDQENFSRQVRALLVDHKVSLLGPRTTSDTGFFLAPYFTYIIAPFYLLTNMHPSALIYLVVTYNLAFLAVSTFVLSKLFSFRFALLFLLFWAGNFMMVQYDTIPWWPIVLPLGIFLTIYLLFQIQNQNSWKHWLLLGVTLGLFVNMHFQYVFIIFFAGVFLAYHYISTKKFPWKNILIGAGAFAVMFAPLVLFDLRNNFLNTNLFFNFFFGSAAPKLKDHWIWITVFTNVVQPFLIIKSQAATIIFYFVMAGVFGFLLKTAKPTFKSFYVATLLLWFIFPFFFWVYGQRPSEYYFLFLYPFILIGMTDFFFRIKMPLAGVVLSVIFIGLNMRFITPMFATNPYGMYYKDKTARYLSEQYKGKNYIVSFDVELGREPGFRYIFEQYGILTHNEQGNPDYPLIEVRIPPKDPSDVKVSDQIGLKIPKELQ